MKANLFFVGCLLLLSSITWSQNKPAFTSINQAGILSGSSDDKLQIQTINGISRQSLFAGIGLGLDYYYVRSVPVFMDLRKSFSNKANTPFIYLDGGYSFLWEREKAPWQVDSKGGIYYGAGLGYQAQLTEKMKLVLDCGYSYKRLSREMDNAPWSSMWPHSFDTYTYSLKRISIKAGLRF